MNNADIGYLVIRGDYMSEIKRGRGYVYAIQYHIVWYVKYRHKILVEKVDFCLNSFLRLKRDCREEIFGILLVLLQQSVNILKSR